MKLCHLCAMWVFIGASSFSPCWSEEMNAPLDAWSSGPAWLVVETNFTEMRNTVYSRAVERSGCELSDLGVEEPYVVTRVDVRKNESGKRETVWSGETAYPRSIGPFAGGMSPHAGLAVWDVSDCGGNVWVLWSVGNRLHLDVQSPSDSGSWTTVKTYPLEPIHSVHFEGKICSSENGVCVKTAQWNQDFSKDGEVRLTQIHDSQDSNADSSP